MILHPWHEVSPGDNLPNEVNAIIEIPKGSRVKYEVDKTTGLIKMDRVIFSAMHYPVNYGFIPQTYGMDKDPLDILVLTHSPVVPLCLIEATVIGVMRMIDHGDADDKIIAVASNDVSVNHIKDIGQLPKHFFDEIRNFFEEYKKLENKEVVIDSFLDKEDAERIILEDVQRYKDVFLKKDGKIKSALV